MELSIIHRPETNRFETVVDGVTAYVESVSYTHLTLPTKHAV